MGDVPPPDADLAGLTASLQSDARDSAVFFRVLCSTLEAALPASTTVERDHSLFKDKRLARRVTVHLGDDTFEAELSGERILCRHTHAVHGVGGGLPFSREVGVDEWVTALLGGVSQDARASASATEALRALTT